MNVVAYLDRFSYRPGDEILCMANSEARVDVDVVRLFHGDTNPAGPGFRAEPVESVATRSISPGVQRCFAGSVSVEAWVWPTAPLLGTVQGLMSLTDDEGAPLAALALDGDGQLHVRSGDGTVLARLPRRLLERRWYRVAAMFGSMGCTVEAAPLHPLPPDPGPMDANGPGTGVLGKARGVVVAALAASPPTDVYNGKVEHPVVAADGELLAEWAFELEPTRDRAVDVSGRGCHGQMVNRPARAMTGHGWSGASGKPADAPAEYGAVHFHDDDLSDAGWDVSARITLPPELASGVYAVRLRPEGTREDDADHVPFAVLPGARRSAAVVFLLPSFTYTAYANERPKGRVEESRLDPRVRTLVEHPEWGSSMYDRHTDGSGVCYSTLARPVPCLRPQYRAWLTGAPRHLAGDLYIVDWMDRMGIECDVITDHDLHALGPSILDGCQVLVTGSHPEYVSAPILDALDTHLDAGGSLVYLGGNGFYWVTSQAPDDPATIEVRRHGGTRTWDAQPGEHHHSTTGEPGGLWRSRGRSPNRLAGIGFAAQGWSHAVGYRRTPLSFEPELSWVFEGVTGELFGTEGLVMGGAVGDEIDCFDPTLGSPPHTALLATSLPLGERYHQVVEDVLAVNRDLSGVASPRVRSDMAVVEHVGGGAVFSVGSIAFSGTLSAGGYSSSASTIVGNVVRHLAERKAKA